MAKYQNLNPRIKGNAIAKRKPSQHYPMYNSEVVTQAGGQPYIIANSLNASGKAASKLPASSLTPLGASAQAPSLAVPTTQVGLKKKTLAAYANVRARQPTTKQGLIFTQKN